MTYAAVDTAYRAARANGDVVGQIELAMLKMAGLRIAAIQPADDQRETQVCRAILDAATPPLTWVKIALIVLDVQGKLATRTDAEVDLAMTTAWGYFIKSRG